MDRDLRRADRVRQGMSRPDQWVRVETPGTEAVVASYETVIAGGGPAGLSAGYELTKHGRSAVVLEGERERVGGISRTDVYKGYRFDIGGHRFFSKNAEINEFWTEILGDELLDRPRLSRIYYNRKFFHYPLKAFDALWKLGPICSARVLASYVKARIRPIQPERSVEDWVTNRFGRLLFEIFFKTYTEKVWGIPTSKISADWAAQRIQALSLWGAVWNALFGPLMKAAGGRGAIVKTLIDRFRYPRLGPGQMWEAARDRIEHGGGGVHMDRRVVRIEHDETSITAMIARDESGREHRYVGTHFISTLPIRNLVECLDPAPPAEVLAAGRSLKYRDFLTVVLIADQAESFPDCWIYVHDPNVKLGRVQNFKNWSPWMVPDSTKTSLGLEYFCFEGDGLWTMADAELIELGKREIEQIGLVSARSVIDGCVVRMPKAYPVYDEEYKAHVETVRRYLERFDNLQLAGRNGMHKYNNQDHSMLTALLAARNIMGLGPYDPWRVNTDAEYHEEEAGASGGARAAGRAVPRAISS
jgi:protoporphyrinogen oxidase